MAHTTHTISPFSENPDFDLEIRSVLGQTVAGASDPGEVLAAVAGIRKGDHVGWFHAWHDLAERTTEAAQTASKAGHRVSAADGFLRASVYFGVAVNAVSGLKDSAELVPTFREQRDAWDSFVAHTPASVERVDIPLSRSGRMWLRLDVVGGGTEGQDAGSVALFEDADLPEFADGVVDGLIGSATTAAAAFFAIGVTVRTHE